MSTKVVCYGKNKGDPPGGARGLTDIQWFAVLVIEHVLGSELFYMDKEVDDYLDKLTRLVQEDDFFLTDVVFQRLIDEKIVTPTAIYTVDALHGLMNWAKKHVDQEWRIHPKGSSPKDTE